VAREPYYIVEGLKAGVMVACNAIALRGYWAQEQAPVVVLCDVVGMLANVDGNVVVCG